MESLMEEEAKDSVSAIKNLREKAMLAKGRYASLGVVPVALLYVLCIPQERRGTIFSTLLLDGFMTVRSPH